MANKTIKEAIEILKQEEKRYPKMWTKDVIMLLENLKENNIEVIEPIVEDYKDFAG